MVVPKGSDELREDLNEVIIENTEDGTLAEIYDEYLGMDKSIEDFDEYLDEDE
ncbi:transporter substrate-binding domain-containing protein [Tetragenococcus halophilus]|nr:transporter substrate-binding domain-containing protein [Tetragenococcus halophilus]